MPMGAKLEVALPSSPGAPPPASSRPARRPARHGKSCRRSHEAAHTGRTSRRAREVAPGWQPVAVAGAHDDDPGLPIKLGPCSNGEYVPPPPSPLVRETWRRADADIERTARRLGLSRRRFLATLGASAAVLLALDGCTKDRAASERRDGRPGRHLRPPAGVDHRAGGGGAVLAGDEFIMDVQGHLLDYDLEQPTRDDGFWQRVPPGRLRGRRPAHCFDAEHFLDLYFLQSDTSLVVLSARPDRRPGQPAVDRRDGAHPRASRCELCATSGCCSTGQANPNVGSLEQQLDGDGRRSSPTTRSRRGRCTPTRPAPGWYLDDHDPRRRRSARRSCARRPRPDRSCACTRASAAGAPAPSPADIGPAAGAPPATSSFVVYHSGYETATTEGPYDRGDPTTRASNRLHGHPRGRRHRARRATSTPSSGRPGGR